VRQLNTRRSVFFFLRGSQRGEVVGIGKRLLNRDKFFVRQNYKFLFAIFLNYFRV
jgi:hypothetical protein